MITTNPGSTWSGSLRYSARELVEPASLDELRRTVSSRDKVHALGTRHSFSAVADTPGTLISTARMPGGIDVDTQARTVRVPAATRYGELAQVLDARGLALGAMASLPHISVAGTIATGTHGSGVNARCLSDAAVELEMVTASGDLVTLRRDRDAEFDGAVVALGALGVVTTVTLTAEQACPMRQAVYQDLPPESADQQGLEAVLACASSVSLFTRWQSPGFDQVWVKERTDGRGGALSSGDGRDLPTTLHGAHRAPAPVHPLPGMPAGNCTDQSGEPGPAHERLPHFRLEFTPSAGEEIQSEYLIGREDLAQACAALRPLGALMEPVLLVSEIRAVAADDLWLSMAQGRDSAALHFTWRRDPAGVVAVLPHIEEALAPFSPRPHWGKVHSLAPDVVRGRWTRADDFAALAARMDPAGRFSTPLLKALKLTA